MVVGISGRSRSKTGEATCCIDLASSHGREIVAGSITRAPAYGGPQARGSVIHASRYNREFTAGRVANSTADRCEAIAHGVHSRGFTAPCDGCSHSSPIGNIAGKTANHVRSEAARTWINLRLNPQGALIVYAELQVGAVGGSQKACAG